jgi:hypothetical protein
MWTLQCCCMSLLLACEYCCVSVQSSHSETRLCCCIGRPHTANNGADDDASKRVRYALLGNAVSVCVARWLGAQLMEPYK